ncbi:transporter (formate/nitrite transporter family protein) [Sagittula sp. P11]|jgi:formate/nitrite transporter FocA (FNT family)|nr:transporter (formate/nitrite transporter family protein) [Sagittula sp. P11]
MQDHDMTAPRRGETPDQHQDLDPEAEQEAVRSHSDESHVTEASRLSARLIYEVIRRDGDEELQRPVASLVWSGLAAGVLISLSVLTQAVLKSRLPEADWALLVEGLGYSVGFMVVIFGRMQLFTENTITTVLPVVADRSLTCLLKLLRLWAVVLCANIVGCVVASGFLTLPFVVQPDVMEALIAVSHHAVEGTATQNFVRAMPAGLIIAALVWILPATRNGGSFFVVMVLTWLITAAGFAHVIAGSVEAGLLVWVGEMRFADAALVYFLPVLAGNVAGGTAVFTLLVWGQVRNEVEVE